VRTRNFRSGLLTEKVYPVGHAAFRKGQAHFVVVGETNFPLFIPEIVDSVLDWSPFASGGSVQIWRESALLQVAGADRFPGDITMAPRVPPKRTLTLPFSTTVFN
jgi:hypothetical protein